MHFSSLLRTIPDSALQPQEAHRLCLVDRLAVIYLALPVLIFFLGWFTPVAGAVLSVFLLLGLSPLIEGRTNKPTTRPLIAVASVVIGIALLWTLFGGTGHFVFANADWRVRDAVLRDLVVTDWPPSYGSSNGIDSILRCPVGYYLPAALAAKLIGLSFAHVLLFLWTAIGVALFFLIALSRLRTAKEISITVLVIVFFSGMDILGLLRSGGFWPDLTDHIEWWAIVFQYSSNTTQLFWVPNHALPGWIVAALLYKHWHNPEFLKIAPIALAVTALWSPLVTIGFAPFAALLAWSGLREGNWKKSIAPLAWIGAIGVFIPIAAYLTLDGTKIPSGWTFTLYPDLKIIDYVFFVLFEFAILALLIWRIRRCDLLSAIAAGVLLLLPLYTFGQANDLAMRASIPALMILCLSAAEGLCSVDWQSGFRPSIPLVLCLLIGAVTPLHEIARSVLAPRWKPNLDRSLIEVARGMPPHYVGRLDRPLLAKLMRRPAPVAASARLMLPVN